MDSAEPPVGITSVNLRRPTLEDVFVKLTGRAIREEEASALDTMRRNVPHAWRGEALTWNSVSLHEFKGAYTIWYRDVLRFVRDRSRIFGSLAQPLLFLVVLGFAGQSARDAVQRGQPPGDRRRQRPSSACSPASWP